MTFPGQSINDQPPKLSSIRDRLIVVSDIDVNIITIPDSTILDNEFFFFFKFSDNSLILNHLCNLVFQLDAQFLY